ncbi:hypothetical protein LRAMOSA02178 [Lichtheimia ramosa]|uniref:Uncharacterized protein n=1 Tax=Lichtheimia ramosa TaxID=688394 RepID=A0A077WL97_9FUNG|nr:hypothetical protein LRAMOSA02178 [Lichtheimia ramosa]
MHVHSLALLATVCLFSLTSHAAPLAIKRDNQPQGGLLTGVINQANTVTQGTDPALAGANGVAASVDGLKTAAEGLVPIGPKGITATSQANTALTGATVPLDNALGGGGKKQQN